MIMIARMMPADKMPMPTGRDLKTERPGTLMSLNTICSVMLHIRRQDRAGKHQQPLLRRKQLRGRQPQSDGRSQRDA
jgi:hypothetical protein